MSLGRRAHDFYETPPWVVDALIHGLPLPPLGNLWILEPSAGRGAIVRRLLLAGARPETLFAHDVNPDHWKLLSAMLPEGRVTWGDFLALDPAARPPMDLVIMNPPYNDAARHVEHALKFTATGGVCAALLRLAFLCSRKRAEFRRRHPADVFPLAARPSFTNTGTDSADYAWFVWGPGRGGHYRVLEAPESETLFNGVEMGNEG